MKKTLWCFSAVAAGLLAGAPAAQAQQPPKAVPTIAELAKNMETISEGDETTIDDLADRTARQLVTYLKAHALSDADQATLGLDATDGPSDAAHLRVYTFGYSSGGTRGTVHVPVLQWQNAAGKRFAYKLGEECAFSEIHRLTSPGRMLYLLLGQETANSYTELSVAYVLELKGDYLLVNNVAFGQGPSLSLGDVEMKFDDGKQLFYLTAVPNQPPPIPKEIYVANKTPLSAWAQRGQRAPKAVTL
jgi:hypothetical protein